MRREFMVSDFIITVAVLMFAIFTAYYIREAISIPPTTPSPVETDSKPEISIPPTTPSPVETDSKPEIEVKEYIVNILHRIEEYLDRAKKRLDQSSLAAILVYFSAFSTLIYLICKAIISLRKQKSS